MAKVLGLDLGTNAIGWAIVATANSNILNCGTYILPDVSDAYKRRRQRMFRRDKIRSAHRLLAKQYIKQLQQPAFIEKVKKLFPVLTHTLLAVLFAGSLLMAVVNHKDFQFWFNLAITVLLAWIALKK